MPLAAKASNNIYPTGALVLRMLARYLGPERFWSSLHTYLTRHALGNATSDDLRQAVLLATGENLAWFWDEWVYEAGYPELTVAATYDSAARRLTLAVKQTQTDTAKADSTGLRFTTPAVFRMPVTIRVGTAAGDVVKRVTLDAREQTIALDGVAGSPTMVVFDDGNAILKTLAFDEPTSWLATQLERDPDLWNRHWVIAQLGLRPADTAAAMALAKAATGADYFLTRAGAAQALAPFPASTALPALQAALKDTSAQVRAAAVEALGNLGGASPQAAALAHQAWTADSSDAVRAAAVVAVAQTDSVGRRAMILQALRTPSYRDAVQNSAYRAIARAGDTTMVDSVDAHAGEHRFAPHVLAALASRGSARALGLLVKHLSDERAYVRRWTVESFAFTLRRDIAQPTLQAAHATLKFADTRQAVDELLQEWQKEGKKSP